MKERKRMARITRSYYDEGKEVWQWRIENRIPRLDFADYAQVSVVTLLRFERGGGVKKLTRDLIMDAKQNADVTKLQGCRKIPPMG